MNTNEVDEVLARLTDAEERLAAQNHLMRALFHVLEAQSPGIAETIREQVLASATFINLKINEKHQSERDHMAARALRTLYGI